LSRRGARVAVRAMAKKAQSAYFIWLGEQRSSIVEQYDLKGKKGSEVSKKAGEVWKAMAPADKKKWEDLAAKDKVRYEEEVQTLGKRERVSKPDKDAKRAKKDKDAPKRPMTPYFLWLNDNRKAIAEQYKLEKLPEVAKKAAEVWKGLAAEAKKPYEEKAETAKAQYQTDMVAYKASVAAGGVGAAAEEEEDDDAAQV